MADDIEATLDAEWASAAAPSAAIVVAACADTDVTSGLFIAMQNLVNASNPPQIMSMSYGNVRRKTALRRTPRSTRFISRRWPKAFRCSSRREMKAQPVATREQSNATHGIGVSGFASTPYNVAVGGTDFSDDAERHHQPYWSHDQHRDLRLGDVLYPRNSVERLLRGQSCSPTIPGYSTGYGAGRFLQ